MMEVKLIEFVKKNKFIYNRNSKYYKNKYLRDQKFQELADELDIPAIRLKHRWRTLRDKFYKEIRDAKLTPNDDDAGNIPKKQWKWMEYMMFLKDGGGKLNKCERPDGNFANSTRVTVFSSSDSNEHETSNQMPTEEIAIKSDNLIDEFLCSYEETSPIEENVFPTKPKRRKINSTTGTNSSVQIMTQALPDTNCEISQFFQCLATKVKTENLSRDEKDIFQEALLRWVNKKLAELRKAKPVN